MTSDNHGDYFTTGAGAPISRAEADYFAGRPCQCRRNPALTHSGHCCLSGSCDHDQPSCICPPDGARASCARHGAGSLGGPNPLPECGWCGDTGWCVHRKATYYGPPEDFTIADRRAAADRARARMASLPRYYRPTVHRPGDV